MANEFDSVKDLEYMLDFKQKYPEVFKDFIREQLRISSESSISSLEYIRSLMPSDEILTLVSLLNDSDRNLWKTSIGKDKAIKDPAKLMTHIKSEMTRAFIAAKPSVDPEVLELTLKLKVHDVSKFCQSYPDNAGELLNLLNPSFISKVLDRLPVEKATVLLQNAFEVTEAGTNGSGLHKNLKSFISKSHKNSMAVKLLKVLEGVDPKKEKMIYKHMLRASSADELIEVAAKNCPMEVLWYIPKQSLGDALQAYPLNKKARFLISLEDEKKQQFLDASSAEGSSARQMIDMELKQIEENPMDLKRCMAQKDVLLLEFLKFFREFSGSNEQILSDIKMACHQWFGLLEDDSSSTQKMAA